MLSGIEQEYEKKAALRQDQPKESKASKAPVDARPQAIQREFESIVQSDFERQAQAIKVQYGHACSC
jgi:hypothetical protein